MNYKLISGLIVAAAASAGLAFAADGSRGPGDGERPFRMFDENGDGKIAVKDLDARHKEFIAGADADGDGFITKEEMQALHEARKEERRADRFPDANGDGVVDLKEFETAAKNRFKEMDANGDGTLTEDEMRDGFRKGHKEGRGRRRR